MIQSNNVIWKPLKDYEDLYKISSDGVIKSLKTSWLCGRYRNYVRSTPERVITQRINDNGYLTVVLIKDGKHHTAHVHRLVARTFIDNPSNLPQVNHKDENKLNNCASNLEWCSCEYNNNYGTKRKRLSLLKTGKPLRKPVLQLSKDGAFIREFSAINEARDILGISPMQIIRSCKSETGKRLAGGFLWRYK